MTEFVIYLQIPARFGCLNPANLFYAMRNFLVNRSWAVDYQIVWDAATGDIPLLLSELCRVTATADGARW